MLLLIWSRLTCFSSALYDKVEIKPSDADKTTPKNLIVVMSSDRGLCGGIHSNLVKAVKAALGEKEVDDSTKIVACGEKARQLFLRTHGKWIEFQGIYWLLQSRKQCISWTFFRKFPQQIRGVIYLWEHLVNMPQTCLTLSLPQVTKTEFLLTISIQYQAGRWWE